MRRKKAGQSHVHRYSQKTPTPTLPRRPAVSSTRGGGKGEQAIALRKKAVRLICGLIVVFALCGCQSKVQPVVAPQSVSQSDGQIHERNEGYSLECHLLKP